MDCASRLSAICMILAVPAGAQAEPPDAPAAHVADRGRVTLLYGPYTHHYRHDADHESWTRMLGIQWEFRPQRIAGASSFRNSFGQRSHYIYAGRRWPVHALGPNAYVKLSGGLLLGYKRPYDDKIPLNRNGIALAAVPALGYRFDRVNLQVNILGTAGFIITFGADL